MQRKPLASIDGRVRGIAGDKAENEGLDTWHGPRGEVALFATVARTARGHPVVRVAVSAEALRPDMVKRELGDRVLLGKIQWDTAEITPFVLSFGPRFERLAVCWGDVP